MGDEVGITFDGNVISLFIKNRRREQFRFKARKNLYGFVHVQGMHTGVELVSASGNPVVAHTEVDVADLRAHLTHLTHNLELKTLDIEEILLFYDIVYSSLACLILARLPYGLKLVRANYFSFIALVSQLKSHIGEHFLTAENNDAK